MASGKMKADTIEFSSRASVQDISVKLDRICLNLDADVYKLEINDPFNVSIPPDIAVVAQGHKAFQGAWAVEICVYDRGNDRIVELVALGDSMMTKAMFGMAQRRDMMAASPNLGLSKKIRNQIADYVK